MLSFKEAILAGIPDSIPEKQAFDPAVSRAPRRPLNLSEEDRRIALKNALRYFPSHLHAELAPEFAQELADFGRIYMYRFRPAYKMFARPVSEYPARIPQAAAIMHMIQNNLDPRVAQHPYELVTYGGNGAVFQNWAQYLLTMQYLANMTEKQTLVMYSGHPMGLFPSDEEAPRVVVTNGMMIPNYSTREQYTRLAAMGVTSYGQMTAGSYMYIGPQGIVHGTTITLLNAGRMFCEGGSLAGRLFVSSGLGGMSGAQAKAAVIAGAVGVIAEVNPQAVRKRYEQGWVNEVFSDLQLLTARIRKATADKESVSLAYQGNIVDLWQHLADENIRVDLGSDQTSLHNPFQGGYYPAGLSLEESNTMMFAEPEKFKRLVHDSLKKHVELVNLHVSRGMNFFDYGNAFLFESKNAGADICRADGSFLYPSYVENIMGPICFDYGFGPFRWVCVSADDEDLHKTDDIAADILQQMLDDLAVDSPIRSQVADNLHWIRKAQSNNLVVGSKARILYSNEEGRKAIALAFNRAIANGELKGPVVLGRDHHDVSGTDSPYRETANIYDGSNLTADMAIHNVIGDSFRGATWVSIHNGGGVGWGEVINGGFGMLLDGSEACERRIRNMIAWDVNNGIARRSWAGNVGAQFAIKEAMRLDGQTVVTMPNASDDELIRESLEKAGL